MPEGRSGGSAASARVGKRIYIFGGAEPIFDTFGVEIYANERTLQFVFVFDLELEQWITLTRHGIDPFPGGHQDYGEGHGAVLFGTNIIVVSRHRVYRLDTDTGRWTAMPPLPLKVGVILTCRVVTHHVLKIPFLVAFGKKTWAQIACSSSRRGDSAGQYYQLWDITPDLSEYGLKVVRMYRGGIQLFSGNSWDIMESRDIARNTFYDGQISVLFKTLTIVGHSQR